MNKEVEARFARLGLRVADVDERFILGAGHGGQKVQKTSSSVWLRHRPTGIEVRCQRERYQSTNRELAWAELCHKLDERLKAAVAERRDLQEKNRRRQRQKSRGQKGRMIQAKKHHARIKSARGRVGPE
jgi:peptide chain release factor